MSPMQKRTIKSDIYICLTFKQPTAILMRLIITIVKSIIRTVKASATHAAISQAF